MIVPLVVVGRILLQYSRYVAQKIAIRWYLEDVFTAYMAVVQVVCNKWFGFVGGNFL